MQLGNQSQVPAKLLIRELFRWSWSKSERNPIVLGVDTIPVSGRSAFPWGKPTRGSSYSSVPSKQQMTHHNEGARRVAQRYTCAPATNLPKQGTKGRIKLSRRSHSVGPPRRQG